jgi:adenylate cyclase class 2
MNSQNKEIEIRFKEINVEKIKTHLLKNGFEDLGEDFFTEVIFYDKALEWVKNRKVQTTYVRLRKTKTGVLLTYKNHRQDIKTVEASEIEFYVSSLEAARDFLKAMNLTDYRTQEKKRHTYKKDNLVVDIDTWPQVPTYLEIEGPSEQALKSTAELLGLKWADAIYENAGNLIEKYYGLKVSTMSKYTFDEITYRNNND